MLFSSNFLKTTNLVSAVEKKVHHEEVHVHHDVRALVSSCCVPLNVHVLAILIVAFRFNEVCHCGLSRNYHNKKALEATVDEWDREKHTKTVPAWNFGNVDIVGHYGYLDLPQGTVRDEHKLYMIAIMHALEHNLQYTGTCVHYHIEFSEKIHPL